MEPTALPAAEMSDARRSILGLVKRRGSAAISELARELGVSYEAVRQQMGQLHRDGWLRKRVDRGGTRPRVGRPVTRYHLSPRGEHLFPKAYDGLGVGLLDAVVERFGREGLERILGDLAAARVEAWRPHVAGLDLAGRLDRLRAIYREDDPFASVERAADGDLRLVERNCPFLNVASERPALCSATVAALSRLLGRRVVREERFQTGDGRCVFRVLSERAAEDAPFELEPEPARASARAAAAG